MKRETPRKKQKLFFLIVIAVRIRKVSHRQFGHPMNRLEFDSPSFLKIYLFQLVFLVKWTMSEPYFTTYRIVVLHRIIR